MFAHHSFLRPAVARVPAGLAWLGGAVALCLPAQAAGVMMLPGAPSGFSSASPSAPSGFGGLGGAWSGTDPWGGLLEGVTADATFSSTYNSNVAANQGVTNGSAKDDFILGLGGSLGYLSKASDLTFGGNYHGTYDEYFNHANYSGYNQGGSLLANYKGGRFSIAAHAGMELGRGSNTNYSSNFVEQTSVNSGLTARYKLSPKTSLEGDFDQSFTSASGRYSNTNSYDLGTSALWRYSALTEFGPGVRYTYRSGSTQTGRTSIGPTLNLNYKLGSKVALNSRIGEDFASYDTGATAAPTFSASVGLTYEASKHWGMNLSLYRDTQADPSVVGGFTQVTSLQLGYHRKVQRALWNVSAGYQINTFENPGIGVSGLRPDQNHFNLNSSLSMPVFANSCNASVFVGFNDQTGGAASNTYDSVQVGVSLSRRF